MNKTKIEWTDTTWNPVTGCNKISPGCTHCYAEKMASRLKLMGVSNYSDGFNVTLHPHMLSQPAEWKSPKMVFVCSMADLFHVKVPIGYIKRVFEVMNQSTQHTFQVLTKRSDRLLELSSELNWSANIWAGVSVENQDYAFRIDHLRKVPSQTRFISAEPLLGPLNLNLSGIHWLIAGGESGSQARPMEEKWVLEIRDQCIEQGTRFFFKQWGGKNKKKAGRILDDRTWSEFPVNTDTGEVLDEDDTE